MNIEGNNRHCDIIIANLILVFVDTIITITRMTKGVGSVVTHETRIREVPGSNPGADQLD